MPPRYRLPRLMVRDHGYSISAGWCWRGQRRAVHLPLPTRLAYACSALAWRWKCWRRGWDYSGRPHA